MNEIQGEGKAATFIFTDNSINEKGFLEDINNIINTGVDELVFEEEELLLEITHNWLNP